MATNRPHAGYLANAKNYTIPACLEAETSNLVSERSHNLVDYMIVRLVDEWKIKGLERALNNIKINKPCRLYKLAGLGLVDVNIVDRYTNLLEELGFKKKDLSGGVNRQLGYDRIEQLVSEISEITTILQPIVNEHFCNKYFNSRTYYKGYAYYYNPGSMNLRAGW